MYGLSAKNMAVVAKWPLVELRLYIVITSTVIWILCAFSTCFPIKRSS